MTDFKPGSEPGEQHGALLQRMTAAVNGVQPNVPALIDRGLSDGRSSVRRRRQSGWIAASAVVALVAVGSTYLASSELRSERQEPTQVGQLEPATPRGLAAAVLAHTGSLGDPLMIGGWELSGEAQSSSLQSGVMMQVAYGNADDGGVELQVVASSDVEAVKGPLCADMAQGLDCRESTRTDGTRIATYSQSAPATGSSPASTFTGYLLVNDTELVSVTQTAVSQALTPLTASELLAIATDPMVGLATSSELNRAGMQIEDFKKSMDSFVIESHGSGSSSGDDSAESSDEAPASP